jgi:hypothetical protein
MSLIRISPSLPHQFTLRVFGPLAFAILLAVPASAATIFSLAGDKDSFGSGLPLGTPMNNWVGVSADPADGSFDQETTFASWVHEFVVFPPSRIFSATLSIATWDLEDGWACDGSGATGCDTRLYLDGIEVLGAFDTTFSPDAGPSSPNLTVFNIDSSLFALLLDGTLAVTLDARGGLQMDAIAVDYSELQINTAPVPEPGTLSLLALGAAGLCRTAGRRKRQQC